MAETEVIIKEEGEEEPVVDPELEARAELYGWRKDFKGDPEKFVSAEDYVDRAETLLPIAKAANKKLETDLMASNRKQEATKTELATLKTTLKKVVELHEGVSNREYDRAMKTIRKEQATAIAEQDTEKFYELEDQKDKLEKPEKIEIEETQSGGTEDSEGPITKGWVEDNSWYKQDPQLGMYATSVETFVRNEPKNKGLSQREILDKITEEVKARFPDNPAFKNLNRDRSNDVDGGGSNAGGADAGGGKKKTFSNMPKDAQAECEKIVGELKAQGLDPEKVKANFIKDYYEQE